MRGKERTPTDRRPRCGSGEEEDVVISPAAIRRQKTPRRQDHPYVLLVGVTKSSRES